MCFGSQPQAPEIVYRGPSQAELDANNRSLETYRQQSMAQQQQFATQLQQQIDAPAEVALQGPCQDTNHGTQKRERQRE